MTKPDIGQRPVTNYRPKGLGLLRALSYAGALEVLAALEENAAGLSSKQIAYEVLGKSSTVVRRLEAYHLVADHGSGPSTKWILTADGLGALDWLRNFPLMKHETGDARP